MNNSQSVVRLKFEGKEFHWEVGESLVRKLEEEHFVKQVFPLHGILACHKIMCSSDCI